MKHIPNILSGLRLGMVGLFIYFFRRDNILAALIVYAAAFFTDILDGYLARRNGWISDLGKILDPLADKLMLLCALVCFYFKGWLLIGGLLILNKKNVVVVSDWWGKFAAGFFNVSVILTLLSNFSPFGFLGAITLPLFCLAIVLGFIAAFHYGHTQVLGRSETKEDRPS